MSIMSPTPQIPVAAALPPTIEAKAYRDAMARLPAAVNIITTFGPEGWYGFTASAVCSVTDSPPTLVVCANTSIQSFAALKQSGVLCVNTVSAAQGDLAMRFAGGVKEMAARFEGAAWTTAVTGAPILEGASVAFDCRIVSSVAVGTHEVFFCEVLAVRQAGEGAGLVYVNRAFTPVG